MVFPRQTFPAPTRSDRTKNPFHRLNQRLGDGCVWVPKTKSWPLPTSPFFISRRKDGVPSIVGKCGKMFPIHFKYVPFWKLFDHLQNYIDGTFTNPEKDPEKGRCLMLKFTNRLFRWCQENHQLFLGMLCRENEIKHQKLKPTLLYNKQGKKRHKWVAWVLIGCSLIPTNPAKSHSASATLIVSTNVSTSFFETLFPFTLTPNLKWGNGSLVMIGPNKSILSISITIL